MKFTINYKLFMEMLKQVGKKQAHQSRTDKDLRISACASKVSVESNNRALGVDAQVVENGQCLVVRKPLVKVLTTFAKKDQISIEANDERLSIDTFSMGVKKYLPHAGEGLHPCGVKELCRMEHDGSMPGRDYDERLMNTCLFALMLAARGHSVDDKEYGDCIDRMYGFLEMTMGPTAHGKTSQNVARILKERRRPVQAAEEFSTRLRRTDGDVLEPWAYLETITEGRDTCP